MKKILVLDSIAHKNYIVRTLLILTDNEFDSWSRFNFIRNNFNRGTALGVGLDGRFAAAALRGTLRDNLVYGERTRFDRKIIHDTSPYQNSNN